MMPQPPRTRRPATGVALAALIALAPLSAGLATTPIRDPGWEMTHPFELGEHTIEAGVVASRDVTLATNVRYRAVGPIVELQLAPGGRDFSAVRPVFSRTTGPAGSNTLTDVLWPIAHVRRRPDETTWRVLLAYGNRDHGGDPPGFRTVVFPVFFHGRDGAGTPYLAVFPIGGSVHDFLWQDTIDFALFPLYLRTQANDVVSQRVLWPLVTWSHGDDREKLRIFPLFGRSSKKDESERMFVLWPLWTTVRYTDPENPGSGFVLFPLLGHSRTRTQASWMVLPPFFRFSTGEDSYERLCPWPFVQIKRSPTTDRTYIWPLWGHRRTAAIESRFLLWPIFRQETGRYQDEIVSSWRMVPFFHRQIRTPIPSPADDDTTAAPDRPAAHRWKLWPLMSYRREAGASRFRAPALWPAPDMRPIEQNLAPLWSVFTRETRGRRFEEELLWGLYRRSHEQDGTRQLSIFPLFQSARETDGDSRWSILGGLFGFERKALRRRLTLLYWLRLPLGSETTYGVPREAGDSGGRGDRP